jgi:hypothetical protein
MVLWLARGFDKLGDNMRRRRQIGITHAEIDDIFPPVTRLHLHTVDDAEDVRWEPLNPLKFHATFSHLSKWSILNYFYKGW